VEYGGSVTGVVAGRRGGARVGLFVVGRGREKLGMMQTQGRRKEPTERIHSGALKLEFGAEDAFGKELRRRVDDFFRSTGRRKRGGRPMVLKTAIILTWFAVSYVLLVFGAQTLGQGPPPLAGWNNRRRSLPGHFTLVMRVRRPSSFSWPSVSPSAFFAASSSRSSWHHDFGPYIILSCIPIFDSVLAPFYRRLSPPPS